MQWGSGITYLAETRVKGVATRFGVKDVDRAAHLALIGKRGSGRADFLANMALQDAARGAGVLILDGIGNLAQRFLERVPVEARERLVIIDPSDGEHPYSWNPLDDFRTLPPTEAHEHLVDTLSDMYQAPSGPLLSHIAAEMLNRKDASLLLAYDIVDPKTRESALPQDADARHALEDALTHDAATAAIAEHGRYIARDVLMRNILGQVSSKFTFARLVEGGIVIMDFSRIRMYPTRMQPLVRLFVNVARVYEHAHVPVAVYLEDVLRYLDADSFGRALLEGGIAFAVADTAYGEETAPLREGLLHRAGSVFTFAPAAADLGLVGRVFYPYVGQDDLERLEGGQLAVTLAIDSVRSRPFFAKVLPLPERSGISTLDLALESREKFTISRLAADKLFRPKPTDAEKKDGDPGSFSNAFRSIFANRAGGAAAGTDAASGAPKASPAAPAKAPQKTAARAAAAPAAHPVAPVKKQKPADIPEKELKAMVKVKKRPGRKKKIT